MTITLNSALMCRQQEALHRQRAAETPLADQQIHERADAREQDDQQQPGDRGAVRGAPREDAQRDGKQNQNVENRQEFQHHRRSIERHFAQGQLRRYGGKR